ncbi:Reverse transcriptase zinc-binding domain [Macleaya cordata]|uniref:Reverse transcriptase zinc-binding domain n=1 Tax=Macleaya cordata TaxID=56857 RepID=A0A200RA23_MACCD|nr:Reverse transcriptase zinc-binding domain [Macleaya cordata]
MGKDSLWVAWITKNLIKNRNFWSLSIPNDCSWSWRRILGDRHLARNLIIHRIGDGTTTKFWLDPWHPEGILANRFPHALRYDSILHREALVSTCISNFSWNIPEHLVNNLGNITTRIHEVEIDTGMADELVWKPNPSGEYSLKSAYNVIRPTSTKVPWAKLVFFSMCIPRHSFIAWMTLHRALKTKYKLRSWGLEVDSTCSFSQTSIEDDFHILFGCPISKFIWKSVLQRLGFSRGNLYDWLRDKLVHYSFQWKRPCEHRSKTCLQCLHISCMIRTKQTCFHYYPHE